MLLGNLVAFGSAILFLVSMARLAIPQHITQQLALQMLPVNVGTITSALLIHGSAIRAPAMLTLAMSVQPG
jgi:hypothetical protein